MTRRTARKPAIRKDATRKLKLSKETLKDLAASTSERVKGGRARQVNTNQSHCVNQCSF